MNFRISREAAIVLVLFGAIFLVNPSMWWLIFPAMFMLNNGQRNNENGDERRQRMQERRQAARPQDHRRDRRHDPRRNNDNPFREIGEEIRRQIDIHVNGETEDSRRYNNPTLSQDSRPSQRQTPPRKNATAKRDSSALGHATEAIEAAGHHPDDLALLPVDIGFIAYSEGKRPVRHREAPIPETVNFIQPYVELYLERAAAGVLRFEIVDGAGQVHYVREERRQLKAGTSPIIPGTRMPVGDFLYTDGDWALRIYAAGTLIAEHRFAWGDTASAPSLREHMAEDGELSADLAELIEDARLQPMSIDDLLSDQPAAQQQAARRR